MSEPAAATRDDVLIVDDLMLLLMDDDGASVRGAGTLYPTLGGAVLTELALLGRVEVDDSGLNDPRVLPSGDGPLPDPLLQWAHDVVTRKSWRVQPLLVALGADLWRVLLDRLVEGGLLRREESRVLGVFRSTRWPVADHEHEADLRARIRRVLEDGESPDARTAAIIGLLSASGAMPTLRPPLPWTTRTATRAKELERGDWGREAVATAVTRTTAAVLASSAAVAVTSSGR